MESYEIDWEKERYYVMNEILSGKPRIVVCILGDEEGNISRGVAVCSPSDRFDLETGKEWAYGYAVDAFTERSDLNKINRSVCVKMLSIAGADFDNHSYFRPSLSMFEKGIVDSIVVS